MSRADTLYLLISIAALALLGGCSQSEPSDTVQIRTDTVEQRLHYAEEILTHNCMRDAGFKTWIAPLDPVSDDRTFFYGINDVDWAKRNGFGFNIRSLIEKYRSREPNARYFGSLSDTEKERALDAFNGAIGSDEYEVAVPSGGTSTRSKSSCVAIAQGELYGSALEYFRGTEIESDLRTTAINQTLNDPAYAKAIGAWSECMGNRGYQAENPDTFKASYTPSDPSRGPSEQERAAAIAEAECVRDTALSDAGQRIQQEKYTFLSIPWQTELNALDRMRQAGDSKSRTILASPIN